MKVPRKPLPALQAVAGSLPVLARVPERVPLLMGSSYLAAVAVVVPRKVWKGKPRQVGGLTGMTFFNTHAGVPPGPVAEAYWNFHIPGVLIVFGLLGMFHRWLANTYLHYAASPGAIAVYVATLIYTYSPGSTAIVGAVLNLGPMVFIMLAHRLIARRPSPTTSAI